MSLKEYNRKRDFKKTREPKGISRSKSLPAKAKAKVKAKANASFVIQKHAASRLHYDFRLEIDGVLKSWAVPKGPSLDPSQKRLAVQVEDHPLDYGAFEGSIPEGEYGGGTVMLWDRGHWKADQDPRQALKKGALSFELDGEKLHGRYKLVRLRVAGGKTWLLIKERDAQAQSLTEGDILDQDLSVASGRNLDEIAANVKAKKKKSKSASSRKRKAYLGEDSLAGASVAGALTHPDKILYPAEGITKLELARYLHSVAPRMLPLIAERPLMILRCPSGSGGSCFFQKNWNKSLPASVKKMKGRAKDGELFFGVDSVDGLIALAQLGALEIHCWNSQADHIESPDQLVFDLDPDPSVSWKEVAECALQVRRGLKTYGLESFLKTTGGKGLHVVAPLSPKLDWELGKSFSRAFAEDIEAQSRGKVLVNMSKAKRKGKIFLDYLRNGRGATAVAPYSPRNKARAPIAMPIAWSELKNAKLRSDSFILREALKQIKKADPWKDFVDCEQFPKTIKHI